MALLDHVEQRALEREHEAGGLGGAEALEHALAGQLLEEVAGIFPGAALEAASVAGGGRVEEQLPELARLGVELAMGGAAVEAGLGEVRHPGLDDLVLAGLEKGVGTRIEGGHAGALCWRSRTTSTLQGSPQAHC
jgi:hypothetical protein